MEDNKIRIVKDKNLELVIGGEEQQGKSKESYCNYCKRICIFDEYSGGRAYCRSCGKPES